MQTSPSVSYVLRQISRGPRPDRADEHSLVARASRGDRDAVDLLISSHLAYVVHIAKEFRGRGLPFEDLISEGCVGLLKAIRRYRPAEGTRFMTYASFWVRKEVLAAVSDQPNAVHVPRYARQHGYDSIRVLRLDTPQHVDGTLSLSDRLRHQDPLPADTMIESEQTRRARCEVLRLAPRERTVIACRFGLGGQPPQTLVEIGRRLGLSKERVRQIEVSALANLRIAIEERVPRSRQRHRPARGVSAAL